MPEYVIILIILFLVALFFQRKYKLIVYKNQKQAISVITTFFLLGVIWDYIGVYRGHWIFPGNGLIGPRIAGLPIEEFLFFLIIPYVSLVIFKYLEAKA